ncbi:MAG TPA: hypothetical protein PK605_15790 [Ignavibacteria bacterium]|nr:hypothetical protein [Ignavibacteria bacterium]HAX48235.1 hypothetical protein [Bacteroidota bacterium]HRE09301.1 hypothetical protein [Ignavibacteria bacterium]HRF66261.1 hypothetical protein [Ignavibacteria bacterium]HRJ05864.1 hypothetical protein [Ignavibacteria bacterium]
MKKISVLVLGLFIVLVSSNVLAGEKWAELETFHKVMSTTFHPAEEGNFEPIKTRIGEMVEAAGKMNSNPIPAEYNKQDILDAAKKLETDSKALQDKITAGATNEDIFKDLNALHDTFHTIVGLCNPKEEHK